MQNLVFPKSLSNVFEAVKSALKSYRCEEIFSDKSNGNITARKKSNMTNKEEIISVKLISDTAKSTVIEININHHGQTSKRDELMGEMHTEELIELIRKAV